MFSTFYSQQQQQQDFYWLITVDTTTDKLIDEQQKPLQKLSTLKNMIKCCLFCLELLEDKRFSLKK